MLGSHAMKHLDVASAALHLRRHCCALPRRPACTPHAHQSLLSLYEASIKPLLSLYQASIKPLSSLYVGSIKVSLRLYYGSIKALLRLYSGSFKALLRLYLGRLSTNAMNPY
jgi:hypothetical protein